jgi:hypothetical protein
MLTRWAPLGVLISCGIAVTGCSLVAPQQVCTDALDCPEEQLCSTDGFCDPRPVVDAGPPRPNPVPDVGLDLQDGGSEREDAGDHDPGAPPYDGGPLEDAGPHGIDLDDPEAIELPEAGPEPVPLLDDGRSDGGPVVLPQTDAGPPGHDINGRDDGGPTGPPPNTPPDDPPGRPDGRCSADPHCSDPDAPFCVEARCVECEQDEDCGLGSCVDNACTP